MTITHRPTRTGTRRPAWILILTVPVFVAYLAVAVATIAQEADTTSAELTPGQIADFGLLWVLVHLLWIAPPVMAAVGLVLVAREWRLAHTAVVSLLAAVAGVLAATYLGVQLMAFGFGGAFWGDSTLYAVGVVLSLAVGWCGVLPATIVVAVALARRGVRRRTSGSIAALTALYLVVEVLVYLPALLGSATLAETVGIPPFVLGFFWAALGGGLLRDRVPSEA